MDTKRSRLVVVLLAAITALSGALLYAQEPTVPLRLGVIRTASAPSTAGGGCVYGASPVQVLESDGSHYVCLDDACSGLDCYQQRTGAAGLPGDPAACVGGEVVVDLDISGNLTCVVDDDVPEAGDFAAALDLDASGNVVEDAVGATQLDDVSAPSDGECLSYDAGTQRLLWKTCAAGGGETNTASNVGVGGVGVVDGKVGVDLQFKAINAGSAKVTVSDDAGNNEVDVDLGSVASTDLSDSASLLRTTSNYAGSASSAGPATTALALNADGANCAAGEIPRGVTAAGAAQDCYEPTEADIVGLDHLTEAEARTGLIENGSAEMLGETLGTACTDGQILKANATGGLDCAADGGGGGDFMADGSVPMTGDFDGDGNNVSDIGVVFMREQAAADADVAGQGQLWIKTATPNQFWFTDDAGTDFQVTTLTGTETLTQKTMLSNTNTIEADAVDGDGDGTGDVEATGTAVTIDYDSDNVADFTFDASGLSVPGASGSWQSDDGLTLNWDADNDDGGNLTLTELVNCTTALTTGAGGVVSCDTTDYEEEGVTCADCVDLADLDDDAGSPVAGDFLTVRAGATDITYTTPNAGTDITADLEEEVTVGSLADNTINEPDLDIDNTAATGDVLTYDATDTDFAWTKQSSVAAGTAAALASDPTACGSRDLVADISAAGVLTCEADQGIYHELDLDNDSSLEGLVDYRATLTINHATSEPDESMAKALGAGGTGWVIRSEAASAGVIHLMYDVTVAANKWAGGFGYHGSSDGDMEWFPVSFGPLGNLRDGNWAFGHTTGGSGGFADTLALSSTIQFYKTGTTTASGYIDEVNATGGDVIQMRDAFRAAPTDTPPTCGSSIRGALYFDTSLAEWCWCNASNVWAQLDGGGSGSSTSCN